MKGTNYTIPDSMNILAQRWFPIGDIGVGVLLATLAQYWVSTGNIGIDNILSRYIIPTLACHWHL